MIPVLVYFCVAVSYVGGLLFLVLCVAIALRLFRGVDSSFDEKPKQKETQCSQKK